MNRKLLLLILLSFALFSCNDNTQQCKDNVEPKEKFVYDYEVYNAKDIILAEEDRGKTILSRKQLVDMDGKNVVILNIGGNSLSFYDLESGEKVHDIFVDSLGKMKCFHFVGKDSIFIGCSNFRHEIELATPQALRLIDWDGNVRKIYGYEVDQDELNKYEYDVEKLVAPENSAFVFCKGNIISSQTYSTSYGLLGTKESVDNPLPIGIRMSTKENKYHVSKHRKYAYIKEGMYYPTNCSMLVNKSANDLPIFKYRYSPMAFEWDFENDSIIGHCFKSALVDTIMPLPQPAEFGHELPCYYGPVVYDECNQIYVSTIFFNEKIYGKIKWAILFADKDFQYIGEKFEYEYYPSETKKNLALNIRKTSDSTITAYYLKLVKTSRDYNRYIDSCRNVLQAMKQNLEDKKNALLDGCPPIKFVKSQMEIKESNYKILTIYCNDGCQGCEKGALGTLLANKEVLNKVPLYIILSAYNPEHLDSYIETTGLSYFDKVAKDSTGIMKTVAKTGLVLNPRITVVNDGMVILDTIYQALDIEDKLLPQIAGPNENSRYVLNDNGEVSIVYSYKK